VMGRAGMSDETIPTQAGPLNRPIWLTLNRVIKTVIWPYDFTYDLN